MYSFPTLLYSLFKNPVQCATNNIERKNPQFLTFIFFLILLIAGCQYIGFLNSTRIGLQLSSFSYVIFMFFYMIFFFLLIFIESAITGHFLKNRNVTPYPFGSKQVFSLVTLSHLPYLFLPAVSIVTDTSLYILFIFILFVVMLITRYKLLKHYIQFFNLPSWGLVILPTIIQVTLAFFSLFFISSAFTILVFEKLKSLLFQGMKGII